MNNREIFEVAEIEVIAFDAEDIIRTSDSAAPFFGDEDDFITNQITGKVIVH